LIAVVLIIPAFISYLLPMSAFRPIREILTAYAEGKLPLDAAVRELEGLRIEEIGTIARFDTGRRVRCGIPEVILAEGKEVRHLTQIAANTVEKTGRVLITRVSEVARAALQEMADKGGLITFWNQDASAMTLSRVDFQHVSTGGVVGIITAGTSDIRVAEEARVIAEEMGCRVLTAYDVGAAGIHRLFPALQGLLEAKVLVVAAGREGTLPAIVAGLVDRPVIGVPVSTGYGFMGKGEAALASMLQSCSVIGVVNIDAGFTAGALAARIANLVVSK
jgi:pyridinium-3,5-biscarboxylic acid mononucleotide synthase